MKLLNTKTIFFLSFSLIQTIVTTGFANDKFGKDSILKSFDFPNIEVFGHREIQLPEKIWFSTSYSTKLFDRNGFYLIRRGSFFTQDLYADGFKRNDIKVTVDGEQYHNACPNRMDSPPVRINTIDFGSVTFTKSSSLLSTGIYGKIEYHREKVSDAPNVKLYVSGESCAQNDFDIAGSLQKSGFALNFQVAGGAPYKNGNGKSFADTTLHYNYLDNYKYGYYNIGLRGDRGEIKFGASLTYATQISFPYLLMDERLTKVLSGFLSFKNHKVYLNFTDHLMNDGLRSKVVTMETRAKNLTMGVIGDFYEVVFRNWIADNWIQMMNNPRIDNKLMPNIRQIEALIAKSFDFDKINILGKIGIQYQWIGDESVLDFYRIVYPNAKSNKFGVNSSISLIYREDISEVINLFTGIEGATNLPESEQLFLALKRPGTKPNWLGNPTLSQPIRGSLRFGFGVSDVLQFEGFAHYVHNYVEIVSKHFDTKMAQTYLNTNGLILGFNAKFMIKDYFESNVNYLYGENTLTNDPLAEITPLTVITKVISPPFYGFIFGLEHRWENAQKRVNSKLFEKPSSAWNKISVFIDYSLINNVRLRFEINNLLNANYSTFVSYTRNPFSAGNRVYEPGRTIRLTIFFNSVNK